MVSIIGALLLTPVVATAAGGPAQLVAPKYRITEKHGRSLAQTALKRQVHPGKWRLETNAMANRHEPLGGSKLHYFAKPKGPFAMDRLLPPMKNVSVYMIKGVARSKSGLNRVLIKDLPRPLYGPSPAIQR